MFSCNKIYQRKTNEKLKERFFNTYNFSNHDSNKFILLSPKNVYPYEYVDDWEKFNRKSLPEKEDFYSQFSMVDVTDSKRVCKDFEIKNLGEYHDLYVQSDKLLLADVFENVGNMCLEIYEHDPAKLLSVPGLAWQPALEKTKAKLDLLTDIYRLLIVEKGIRGRICNAIYGHVKANNKYMNDYDETKESS